MTLEQAISLAARAHEGQTDKAGAPYILHPLRVMLGVETEDERIVAVMHDVLEDCRGWDEARLFEEGFSEAHVDALWALCRQDDESYEAFIQRCGANELARRVKLADLRDNRDLSRIAAPSPADYARNDKYGRAMLALSA